MLDIQFIRDHAEEVRKAARDKNLNPAVVDEVIRTDNQRRELIDKVEKLRARRNEIAKELAKAKSDTLIKEGTEIKKKLKDIEPQLKQVQDNFKDFMLQVPSVPAEGVPVGPDESGNQVVRRWGTPPKFSFKPLDHIELGEKLDLIDVPRGVKIGGFRSFFTKNELVLLEYGLLDYALRHMIKQGFTPMTVPWLVNDEALFGTGYFPWGIEDHYTTQDGKKLIGTAEVSLTAYHAGEVLQENQLPVKLVGISPCFRREVGSYGKDTRGIFRLHQFSKVEQVVLHAADKKESELWHERMLSYAEDVLRELELPYQIVLMCTGDMGAGQVKKYDIETWYPSQERYRETHSDSYFYDFQARRLNLRYRTGEGEIKYVYTLNNTVIATPRVLGAILENYQQEDGSVTVPKILRSYVGKDRIAPKA
ncbi:MAG: serine--tRNA ligase [Candidatus Chisholmbacteria bacterium RIFCSPLOWO2_01_FULL_50_28]|uniref:Serine--tRNA ligase n=1 Tax=Candidatus Chisholmbacteria bacterium RIFCSPHIGHO2_01_FULL_52_32 TaxID=1797591 RepID=A0A1G1VTD0_9BACT|nr:MAG: serine--tRNA ligase [Candidatus Chisholmbacteria bacterium RIFCSPHIGHO2_01_FULL_52_32]OGY19957.1 MAG: serine--tRNA ligase [Candidatus Chisholmbacteria bacterium RIFCSPLOWO2_01_FULL_50_28]